MRSWTSWRNTAARWEAKRAHTYLTLCRTSLTVRSSAAISTAAMATAPPTRHGAVSRISERSLGQPMDDGRYIPERGAGLTPQDFPNLPSGPALGFNSCSLCGHGGTSGSILARIREYVTFYANSDADLSDDMAIGRQEVSKSVMEILTKPSQYPRRAVVPDESHVAEPQRAWGGRWEPWAAKGYNYCPDCGASPSPPVGPK